MASAANILRSSESSIWKTCIGGNGVGRRAVWTWLPAFFLPPPEGFHVILLLIVKRNKTKTRQQFTHTTAMQDVLLGKNVKFDKFEILHLLQIGDSLASCIRTH